MKPSNHFEYLIVGYGVAGYFFCRLLEEQGHSFKVFSSSTNSYGTASSVAYPLLNPLALKRVSPTWRMHETQTALHHATDEPVSSLFRLVQLTDFKNWNKRIDEYQLGDYICPIPLSSNQPTWQAIQHAYKGNTHSLPEEQEQFDFELLRPECSEYGTISYDHIVFCEGIQGYKNPYFQLPLVPNKGIVIKVQIKGLKFSSKILSGKGIFFGHDRDDIFFIGASHSLYNTQLSVSYDQIDSLLAKASELIGLSISRFNVCDVRVAVRPTTKDRKPVVGRHAHYKNMYVINGLGARGYSLSPMLSNYTYRLITKGEMIPHDFSLYRFD